MRAGLITLARPARPARAGLNLDPSLFLNVVAPALLLGILKWWTVSSTHKYGIYFTAEAFTFVYSYFALARGVYVHRNGTDANGRRDAALVRKAKQDFQRQLAAKRGSIIAYVGPLFLVAIGVDLMLWAFGGERVQRPEAILGIVVFEIVLWLGFGPLVALAMSQWSTVRPLNIAAAGRLINENLIFVIWSFAIAAAIIFAGGILGVVALHATLHWSPLFMLWSITAAVIAFAIWAQGVWSDYALARFDTQSRASPHYQHPSDFAHTATGKRQRPIGRIGRASFWVYVAGIFVAKIAIIAILGGAFASYLCLGLDLICLFALVARFRDFDQPAWLAILLWIGLGIVLPAMLLLNAMPAFSLSMALEGQIHRILPMQAILVIMLPNYLLFLVAGLIPGHSPPDLPEKSTRGASSPTEIIGHQRLQSRIDAIAHRR